eukprot:scaffold109258_cov17-Tisochrysis_lutea.AAC.1
MAHTRSMIRWAWASSLNMGNCARSTLEKNTLSTQYELIGGNTENTREYFQLDKLVAEEALIQSTCARPHKNLETLVPQRKLRGFEHPVWAAASILKIIPQTCTSTSGNLLGCTMLPPMLVSQIPALLPDTSLLETSLTLRL